MKKIIEEDNAEDRILQTEYSDIMSKSFIDYAMSVIIARALPDVRDGLKPVQRRVLYDMYDLKINFNTPYRKCARIVGDTMGRFHPHGDSSIYDSLVVMSQDFKKGLPLVDGHGNFGNIEGDGAAAMRYTEARLQKVTQLALLKDLDKDVVDFIPNYDNDSKNMEPSVLPSRIPNLLVNGSEGIAVGMATNIAPHNLAEVIDAAKAYMQNPDITTEELLEICPGPDFPTGGIIVNKSDLVEIYETGMGKIKVRGKVEVENVKGGKTNVIVTEIPYTMIGANIGKFLSDVAQLAEDKKTNDLVDITNQSSKEGIRIVFELKKDADVDNFINMLYKKTRLEDTFGVNMLAICDGRPETMGLRRILAEHVKFQYEINTRKYKKLLEKEYEKKEIQEGLMRAVNVIDLIIEILRGSKDRAQAKACMTEGKTDGIKLKKESRIMASMLNFTERQANAILDMRLYRLIGLELNALYNENEETIANIARYEDILSNESSMKHVIMNEMDELKSEFSVERRTEIIDAEDVVFEEKKEEVVDVYFVMDRFGYARNIDVSTYERNKEVVDSENRYVFMMKSDGKVAIFTDKGNLHVIKAKDLPMCKLRDKGVPIDNISNYSSDSEHFLYVTGLDDITNKRFVFGTKQAMLKITDGSEFDIASKRMVAATKLNDDDELVSVCELTVQKNIVLRSKDGFFLRFGLEEIPEKKKNAAGVRGMKLGSGDFIEEIYYTQNAGDNTIEYNGKPFDLHAKVKPGHRDTKGTKIRS